MVKGPLLSRLHFAVADVALRQTWTCHSKMPLNSPSALRGGKRYEDTIANLKIGKHTRVLYQGFTGRQATMNAKESLDYGTNIVGGVKPGVEGEHLGLTYSTFGQGSCQATKTGRQCHLCPWKWHRCCYGGGYRKRDRLDCGSR